MQAPEGRGPGTPGGATSLSWVVGTSAGMARAKKSIERAAEVGCGRVVVWGDEHVLFESYWPAQRRFWAQAVAWLAATGGCHATLTDVAVPLQMGSDVVAALQAAGLSSAVSGAYRPGATVRATDPPAGTTVKRGATVTLFF